MVRERLSGSLNKTMRKPGVGLVVLSMAFGLVSAQPGQAQPTSSYYVYVCAESDDEVAIVRYGPDGLDVVKTVQVDEGRTLYRIRPRAQGRAFRIRKRSSHISVVVSMTEEE